MKYNPSRDIPKAVKFLKTTSPSEIRRWIMEHRTRKDPKTGRRVQHVVSPESVSNWFRRNKEIAQELRRYIEKRGIVEEGVDEGMFQNGVFNKVPCIAKWILKLTGRRAKPRAIKGFLGAIRQVCLGIIPQRGRGRKKKGTYKTIEGWGIKHPARLNIEDALQYIKELEDRKIPSRRYRLALRNFLKSNNVEDWDEISGELEQDAGKYAHIFAEKKEINEIFDCLGSLNMESRDASEFAFKTACRTGATLTAHAKDFTEIVLPNGKVRRYITVYEKASMHKPKRRMEKVIPDDLYEMLKPRIERGGLLFNIEASELRGLLKSAYQQVIPKLAKEIPMPFHFWRHQFAQHLLRETDWNYGLVANLGGWTVETLERYYGKMDQQTAMDLGMKHVLNI